MQMPFEFHVQVTIGASPELTALLQSLVKNLQAAPAIAAETAATNFSKGGEVTASVEVMGTPLLIPEEPAPHTQGSSAEPTPAAAPAANQTTKEYTEVDVRAAMDAARKRIEGESWKENPNSEGYKKYHRQLTAWFKETAVLYGAEKPSALPDSESRGKFIAACERMKVDADDTITNIPY